MRQIQVSGVQGTDISAVYANTSTRRKIPPDHPLPNVGFSCMTKEPADDEIPRLVDDAIAQVLGPRGLSEIIKRGDRVVIKVNVVGPSQGLPGEKGRGIISDPRIVRYVAGKVREIIGFDGSADLKVIDATFTPRRIHPTKIILKVFIMPVCSGVREIPLRQTISVTTMMPMEFSMEGPRPSWSTSDSVQKSDRFPYCCR